jgi:hypothetical protein
MPFLEPAALSIVAFYVVFRSLAHPEPGRFLARLALLCGASWTAEESCVLLYNVYSYSPCWGLFLGHVPILVIVIWPVVIHSAWDLASQLRPEGRLVPLAAAAIVCTDASFIEPLAVSFGLWSWNQPGIFGVPAIGILGWAYFAFLCIYLFEKLNAHKNSKLQDFLVLVLPFLGTHLLVLGTWWGALRWIRSPLDPMIAVGVAWALSILLVYAALRNSTGRRVERETLLLRLPAALFFFALLALKSGTSALLWAYASAFVPPYLTLMAQQYWLNRRL